MWGFKINVVKESGMWKLSEEETQKCRKWKGVVRDFWVNVTGETQSIKMKAKDKPRQCCENWRFRVAACVREFRDRAWRCVCVPATVTETQTKVCTIPITTGTGPDGAFVSLRQAGPCHSHRDTNKGLHNSYHDTWRRSIARVLHDVWASCNKL